MPENLVVQKLWMPVTKTSEGKYQAILSDTSLDRDDEIMGGNLLKEWSQNKVLPALANHKNQMENWVGGWKNIKHLMNGDHSALTAEPMFFSKFANPLAAQIQKQVEEAIAMGMNPGISIGFRGLGSEMKKVDGKEVRVWTKGELVEATWVPIQSNRNASYQAVAKQFNIETKMDDEERLAQIILQRMHQGETRSAIARDLGISRVYLDSLLEATQKSINRTCPECGSGNFHDDEDHKTRECLDCGFKIDLGKACHKTMWTVNDRNHTWTCDECGAVFNNWRDAENHQTNVHHIPFNDGKSCQCETCKAMAKCPGCGSTDVSEVTDASGSTGVWKCNACGKKFSEDELKTIKAKGKCEGCGNDAELRKVRTTSGETLNLCRDCIEEMVPAEKAAKEEERCACGKPATKHMFEDGKEVPYCAQCYEGLFGKDDKAAGDMVQKWKCPDCGHDERKDSQTCGKCGYNRSGIGLADNGKENDVTDAKSVETKKDEEVSIMTEEQKKAPSTEKAVQVDATKALQDNVEKLTSELATTKKELVETKEKLDKLEKMAVNMRTGVHDMPDKKAADSEGPLTIEKMLKGRYPGN